jgi:hypothetical protein
MSNPLKHIFIESKPESHKYTSTVQGGGKSNIPERERLQHATRLLAKFDGIWSSNQILKEERQAVSLPTRKGIYVEFKSSLNSDLITKSMEDMRQNIRLLNIRTEKNDDGIIHKATVYIPEGKQSIFLKKVKDYSDPSNDIISVSQKDFENISVETDILWQDLIKNNYINKKGVFKSELKILTSETNLQLDELFESYRTEIWDVLQQSFKNRKPKHSPLVNSIQDIELAVVESLWTDDNKELIPKETFKWCESWIQIDENKSFEEQVVLFQTQLEELDISYKGNALHFPERAVFLINANSDILTNLIYSTDQLAEFRIGQEAAGFWSEESNIGQTEWVDDLLSKLEIEDSNIKVCVLDSGINNGHRLISPLIDDENCLTINPDWGTDDVVEKTGTGHGTMMAGVVGYGDLQGALESNDNVLLTHKICSVKILPRLGQSEPQHWGDYTEQAIYRAESVNTEKVLLFCMAVTSSVDVDRGKPSSWSGAIDSMCFGNDENIKRLFIISGGNVRDDSTWQNYPDGNRLISIQNPAQSWNALTVGAYTMKIFVNDINLSNYVPIASSRQMSPYNSTSALWSNKWTIKPEVLFEGGNILKQDDPQDFWHHSDLQILTTSKNFQTKQFDTFNGTSSATAEASWLAAKIAYKYPNMWAESIRGLIIHSANWSNEMIEQFNTDFSRKSSVLELMRICGYGIPNFNRTLNSFENGLTLIAQEKIQPFIKEVGKSPRTNEMQLFDFPWPKEELLSLGETHVKLRITLSYFIEPGPGQIGWKDKYRYQSYGLRFDVNKEGETKEEFKQRINKAARDEEYEKGFTSSDNRWIIGKDNRSIGSVHSDIWEGTAADIAACNLIAVYPVIGWWRERHNLKKYNSKTRYSLLVSLETPVTDVELYTSIINKISTPITVEIET